MRQTPCKECGAPTEYNLCDDCWNDLRHWVVARHAPALAEREKNADDGC